jgi:hypothetical protein
MELLGVDIQGRLLGTTCGNLFLWLLHLMLRWRRHGRRHGLTRYTVVHDWLRHLAVRAAKMLAHPSLGIVHLARLLHANILRH